MTGVVATIWAAVGLLAAAFLATAARSLRELTRPQLEAACRARRNEHLAGEIFDAQRPAGTAMECLQWIADALFVVALATALWLLSIPAGEGWRFALAALVAALALLAANVWIPAAVARQWGGGLVVAAWPLFRVAQRVAGPLLLVGHWLEQAAKRLGARGDNEPAEMGELDQPLAVDAEATREAQLDLEAREMIEGVMQLGDAEVSQVMTPRTYMSSMKVGLPFDEAVQFVISSGHSRIPVYNRNRDDIVGILHTKDLLPELVKPPAERLAKIADLLRPAQFVPESKRLDELLQEFQQSRNHLAVVLDEYGGVSGVVSIEDVLEEIVGEIEDEYDDDLADGIKRLDERTAEALARIRIDEVNERLGIQLPEDGDFDTIGGFVFSHLGHIPAVGESVVVDDVRLTVVDVTRRRIERVRIEVLDSTRSVKAT